MAFALDRRTPPGIGTLIVATATGALAMNVFLPSLPAMARYFQADYGVVQLSVSVYLVATAVLQLFIGPASDRYGRRSVMLACLALFIAATLAAVLAPTIEFLLVCRALQAFAAAGMVLSRAIVRDMVEPDQAASRMGYITMGMTLVPMLGPILGGFLDEIYGWQSTFLLTLAFGIFAFALVYLDLGETNRYRSSSMAAQFASYPEVLTSRRFWGYAATAAFTSGAFFAFIGGAPYVATEMLGLSPSSYGIYFAIIGLGYMFGNFLSGRLAMRIGINRMMLSGNLISVLGLLLALCLFAVGFTHPLSLFGTSAFVGIGNGLTMPSANAGYVSVRPHLAGSASGLGGALQLGGGAAMSVLGGIWLSSTSGPYPMVLVMLGSSLLAIAATSYVMLVAAREKAK